MSKEFIKPDVKFPMFPLIWGYIEVAYNKVETYADFTDFINICLNEAERTKNDVKRLAYSAIASHLYSVETNVTYESKAIELLIQKL